MKIEYDNILRKNMINVFKDVLKIIEENGLQENHYLYVSFNTSGNKVLIPKWLKEQYPEEVTIVIQHEYWNFKIQKNFFNIGLSFNDLKADLQIPYENIISFADPYANFGLKLITNKAEQINSIKSVNKDKLNKDNIIQFKKLR